MLHEELLAQKSSMEQQQREQQAQLDKEKAVVRPNRNTAPPICSGSWTQ